MKSLNDCYTLRNGYKIPCVGLGTWQTPDGDVVIQAVKAAVNAGYKLIDTAAGYGNEKGVGDAIKECGVSREDLFIISKLRNAERSYDRALRAFDKTMEELQLEYLDLYMIHWPIKKGTEGWEETNLDTWKALEKIYNDGRVKSIGVCNFLTHHLKSLIDGAEVVPMVDQIEFNPGYMQKDTVAFCRENEILVQAWSPLGTGRMLSNEELISIAGKYNKSVAQLCVRWCIQNGVLPLPKSVTPSRIEENANVFDFSISEADMATLCSMPEFGISGFFPD